MNFCSTKYIIDEKRVSYKTYMRLTIRHFEKEDVGIYSCVASNSLGKGEGSIRLHGKSFLLIFLLLNYETNYRVYR